ncbi:NADH-quinone oxidoreductase subunit N [Planctomycetales bacterium 10988]|nr:NADH-quinone oxidoreductase subunit N [Planctomycetales bacterium 10988]
MSFYQLIVNAKWESWASTLVYLPEIVLCLTIVILLLLRLPRWGSRISSLGIALVGSVIAFVLSIPFETTAEANPEAATTAQPVSLLQEETSPNPPDIEASSEETKAYKQPGDTIFSGLIVYDGLTIFFRQLLILFVVALLILMGLTGIPDRDSGADVFTLILGATVGFSLMVSSNHLLIAFLGVEMASVPSYVLAGTLKGRRIASEAALKFALYGAGAAGVMLYGMSLMAGALGSAHLPTMAENLAQLTANGVDDRQLVLFLGGLMILVGLAFKLSAFPFHFWCPDVFEGATAEVDAFLSVASKAAAIGLLLRFAIGISGVPGEPIEAPAAVAQATSTEEAKNTFDILAISQTEATSLTFAAQADQEKTKLEEKPVTDPDSSVVPIQDLIVFLIGLMAALTTTFGNLAAYGQTNIKRLMAYSTIAHAGYLMMPVAAAVALLSKDQAGAQEAVASVVVYLIAYFFMNLGVFAIIALLRNRIRSEEIEDYAGIVRESPGLVVCFGILMFSLIGLPPLAGFLGKFWIFAALWEAGLITLLFIGGLNTFFSIFYYLRVLKVMVLSPEPDHRSPAAIPIISWPGLYVAALTVPVAILLVFWEPIRVYSLWAAADLFQ